MEKTPSHLRHREKPNVVWRMEQIIFSNPGGGAEIDTGPRPLEREEESLRWSHP